MKPHKHFWIYNNEDLSNLGNARVCRDCSITQYWDRATRTYTERKATKPRRKK
jgi:hypothetical protein